MPPTLSVLALDDDDLWRRSFVRMVRLRGLEAEGHALPEDALAALEAQRWGLITVDFQLGGGWTGARFARAARERLGPGTPPMILISGAVEELTDEDRRPFASCYSKSTPAAVLVDELLATLADTAGRSRSELVLRAARLPRADDEPG